MTSRGSLLQPARQGSAALLLAYAPLGAQPGRPETLDISVIDVEGGQATLFVSPTHESLLVDTGFPGDRDSGRIMEVMQAAGVQELDHLLLTREVSGTVRRNVHGMNTRNGFNETYLPRAGAR